MESHSNVVTRQSKRRSVGVDNTRNLPDSILITILLLLPTESLRYIVRYVCKRWFNIINSEILSEIASIIIQRPRLTNHYYATRLVDICEENNTLRVRQRDLVLPCKGRIRSTCNELLLITEPDNRGTLFVYNLITKVGRAIPQGGSGDCGGHTNCNCGLALTYDKFKGLYKIVHVFADNSSIQCEMFVLKSESVFLNETKWKKIGRPSYVGERKHCWEDPICVNGRYLYWDVCSTEYILSMDISEEKFCRVPLPISTDNYSVLEMGGYLYMQLPLSENHAEFWILNNFETKEWIQLEDVTIGGGSLLRHPQAVAMLKNSGYIIYKRCGLYSVLFAYRLETGHLTDLNIAVGGDERCLARSRDLRVSMEEN